MKTIRCICDVCGKRIIELEQDARNEKYLRETRNTLELVCSDITRKKWDLCIECSEIIDSMLIDYKSHKTESRGACSK